MKRRTKRTRYAELRGMLESHRQLLWDDLRGKMRGLRTGEGKVRQGPDDGENSEKGAQEDLEIALVQLKVETLQRINEALRRLDNDTYGDCFECGDPIAKVRLRALPFAVRCKDCQERRENAEGRSRCVISYTTRTFETVFGREVVEGRV